MTSITFLCSKHPYGPRGGDTVVSRVLIEAAAEAFDVTVIALGTGLAESPVPVTVVPKSPLAVGRILPRALLHRRSAIHERFAPAALITAIERAGAERLIARRVYMAEAALAAGRNGDGGPDTIVDVLESDVLRRRSGPVAPLMAVESKRTLRDEIRCMRQSRSLACLADDERQRVARLGLAEPPRLDIVLPPAQRVEVERSAPIALFVGDRRWAPNLGGLRRLFAIWPRVLDAVPGAALMIAGRPARHEPAAPQAAHVTGYVPDLGEIWAQARLLVAPIETGGGVRVKILEAASRGVPVVALEAALGSIGSQLPIEASTTDEAFIDATVRLLRDRGAAGREGAQLWSANEERWRERTLARQLSRWLSP